MLGLGDETCSRGAAHWSAGLTGGLVGDGAREAVWANITMQALEAKTASLTSIHSAKGGLWRFSSGEGHDLIYLFKNHWLQCSDWTRKEWKQGYQLGSANRNQGGR